MWGICDQPIHEGSGLYQISRLRDYGVHLRKTGFILRKNRIIWGNLQAILKETFDRKGNLVIPSFAVGRTQELLYFIREIKERNLLCEYPDFEVYLDSPLAIEATKVFTMNMKDCFDEEALALVNAGINPLVFPGLHTSTTSEDSKMINFIEKPKVIISASGMCDAGRIRHHLKHNLWRQESYGPVREDIRPGDSGAETSGRRKKYQALWRRN